MSPDHERMPSEPKSEPAGVRNAEVVAIVRFMVDDESEPDAKRRFRLPPSTDAGQLALKRTFPR